MKSTDRARRRAAHLSSHVVSGENGGQSNWASKEQVVDMPAVAHSPDHMHALLEKKSPDAHLRKHYKFFFDLPTRWNDNDQYGHVNNIIYYSYFGTAVTKYLIQRAGFKPYEDNVVCYCVHSDCNFRQAVSFPDILHVGLSVDRIHGAVLICNVAVFKREVAEACAYGQFVYIFADRKMSPPLPVPIPFRIQEQLQLLHVNSNSPVTPDSGGANMRTMVIPPSPANADSEALDQVANEKSCRKSGSGTKSRLVNSRPQNITEEADAEPVLSANAKNRDYYKFFFDLPSRWNDNDQFGSVNNVIYYSYFDTAINKYLIHRAAFKPYEDQVVGYCVDSYCTFRKATAFPDVLHVGLSVAKTTNSSVIYNVAVFKREVADACAYGRFVHVFVDRSAKEPKATKIPPRVREALEALLVPESSPDYVPPSTPSSS